MAVEYMTFQEVLEELQIDEEELKRLPDHRQLRELQAADKELGPLLQYVESTDEGRTAMLKEMRVETLFGQC